MSEREFTPRPELMAEARKMLDQHFRGENVARLSMVKHVTAPVPLDLAIFGAWVELRDSMAMRGNVGPLSLPLDVVRADGSEGEDWPHFEDFVRWAVTSKLREARAELEAGTHPLLDPKLPDNDWNEPSS